MRLGSIDIGTNTILMLIADVDGSGHLTPVADEHIIARLGKGVDAHGIIQEETFHRVRNILARLQEIAAAHSVQSLSVCGTSALRDAQNRQEFTRFIQNELSLPIQILTGQEEAQLTYSGAVSDFSQEDPAQEYAVLDIGGGSTELISGLGLTITSAHSIDIGSVRLTERILKTNPPAPQALEDALQYIHTSINHLPPLPSSAKLIGVAGTLTTAAALEQHLPSFDRNLIHRYELSEKGIESLFEMLRGLTLEEIKSIPQIHPARADILAAGILILREFLRQLRIKKITVSVRGLRYGILLNTFRTLQA